MGKRKLKSFICMLLCICMLIPQSGLAWGAQSGNRLKPDTVPAGEFPPKTVPI